MGRDRMKDVVLPATAKAADSLIASAARMKRGQGMKNFSRSGTDTAWQTTAWEFYRTIGEYRYACDWVGGMLSKAVLFALERGAEGVQRSNNPKAIMSLERLFNNEDDRAEMLRLVGIHFTVAGECYLIAYDSNEEDTPGVIWEVVASTQYSYNMNKHHVNGQPLDTEDHDGVLAIRLWRPDPVDSRRAMSPSRPVLAILGEIARLTDHVAAQVDSRLAGAGILLMPSEMTFPTPPPTYDEEGNEIEPINRQANDAESLMDVLQETMATAIEDRSDPSALVPIIITAPADAIAAAKHMTFWTELDDKAIELRSEAIRRLALGMDMPPEVLQGNADTNHWAAWQADEAAIKSHTEPLLKIITTSLSLGYYRPDLRVMGVENASDFSIGADTSEMRLRPNRSKEALELYNLGELSGESLRRETGFDDTDAMKDDERALWFLRKVAGGSTTPELVEAALRALKVPLGAVADGGDETQEARPTPTLENHPSRELPDQEVSVRRKERRENPEGLIAAGDQLVVRALERAGNRLKNKMQLTPNTGTPAVDLYRVVPEGAADTKDLLVDAWAHVDRTASRYNVDAGKFTALLDQYASTTIDQRVEHDYDNFHTIVASAYEDGQLDLEETE